MRGRIQIQANDVRGLLFEVRVGTGHIVFQPMRLQPGALPHPCHGHMTDPEPAGEPSRGPVGQRLGRRLLRQREHFGFEGRGEPVPPPTPESIMQPRHAAVLEALPPPGESGRTDLQPGTQHGVRLARGDRQNDAGALGEARGKGPRATHGFEFGAFLRRQLQRVGRGEHAPRYIARTVNATSVTVH